MVAFGELEMIYLTGIVIAAAIYGPAAAAASAIMMAVIKFLLD
jgi:hypothetical protein